ncbi:hypothetical protein A2Z33_05185 [Candidatus Gottesmanbacteria bacterium RBG_16_52_11]|uniref:Uncharacterized protein n=1 Tax=Candidatus Gottesmanbacteria bacterium RBG_16_52_11 TaxID=1798374 RepID=A0A1F5YQR1_9BACT|nr:MAG: hypothetical protein A2Z33_05185 [Candidatus Gottesmanbacteria bacterium RBG_16_52_11]
MALPEMRLYTGILPSGDTFQNHQGLCQVAELHVLYHVLARAPQGNLWTPALIDGKKVDVLAYDGPSVLVNPGYPDLPLLLVLEDGAEAALSREFRLDRLYDIWLSAKSMVNNPYMHPKPDQRKFIAQVNTVLTRSGIDRPSQQTLENVFLSSLNLVNEP